MQILEKQAQTKAFEFKYYDTGGEKPVILFLHGLTASKDIMIDYMEALEQKYRCIALDLPGHNGVEIRDIDSLDKFSTFIEDFLIYLNISQVYLIGYSFGGLVCLNLANKETKRINIKKLIILSSPVLGINKGLTIPCKVVLQVLKRFPESLFSAILNSESVYNLIDYTFKLASGKGIIPRNALKQLKLKDVRKIINILPDKEMPVCKTIPTLFIFDKNDILVSRDNYQELTKVGNKQTQDDLNSESKEINSEVQLLSRVGHLRNKEGVELFVQKIKSFCRE